jgi:hypothetical protein
MKPPGVNRFLIRFLLLAGGLAGSLAARAQFPLPYGTNPIPVVTIYATDPLASETGKTGAFTVFRTGTATNSLTVFYAIGGTASNGVDYATLSHTVSIPAGERSAQILITPIDDSLNDTNGAPEPETVVLRLTQPPYLIPATYIVGEPDAAEVFILEHTETNIPPVVKIVTPTDGAKFYANANIEICASAFDLDGFVTTVEFFENGNSLGIVTNYPIVLPATPINIFPPYHSLCAIWSNAPPGDYTLTAVATDNGGATGTSGPVSITVLTNLPPPRTNIPPTVEIVAPQDGAMFYAGANVRICADADDVDGFVTTVEFFAGDHSLGIATNYPIAWPAGSIILPEPPDRLLCLTWSNAPPGAYTLTAVATDNGGASGTSAPVNILVTTNLPPPPTNIPPVTKIVSPTNGAAFDATTNIRIEAETHDDDGYVKTVEFFAGTTSLGVSSNFVILDPVWPPNTNDLKFPIQVFFLTWSNVVAGAYDLTAVATDDGGATGTSGPVSITVLTNLPPPPTNIPPHVEILAPANGASFYAFANVSIVAGAHDADGYVSAVEFFENGASLGIRTNNPMAMNPVNPFQLVWSNAPPGDYTLTAVATDNGGATGTSAPVNIVVTTNLPPPPPPPEVTIYAPDPVAVEGTNFFWFRPLTDFTNYYSGTNTATFLVRRTGDTNSALTVFYDIGGTATNGVDYATIADNVTIPAGKRYALVTIVPLDDVDPVWHVYDTVVLALKAPTNTPPPYRVGWPAKAAAIILEDRDLGTNGPVMGCLPDHSFHFSQPWTNGLNFCLQVSTNLVNWTSVCTNTVVKGSAQFVDPEAGDLDRRFYRAVPAIGPPLY